MGKINERLNCQRRLPNSGMKPDTRRTLIRSQPLIAHPLQKQ